MRRDTRDEDRSLTREFDRLLRLEILLWDRFVLSRLFLKGSYKLDGYLMGWLSMRWKSYIGRYMFFRLFIDLFAHCFLLKLRRVLFSII